MVGEVGFSPQALWIMPALCILQASAVAVEAMESFGGQGYMEDTGLPVILRDALVRGWQERVLCVTKSPAQHSGSLLKTQSRENRALPGSLQVCQLLPHCLPAEPSHPQGRTGCVPGAEAVPGTAMELGSTAPFHLL